MLFAAILATQAVLVQADKRLTIDFGTAADKNFAILAPPGRERADRILKRANHYRKTLAMEFYGRELAEGAEHVCIHVDLSRTVDKGKTLLRTGEDDPSHTVWLHTSEEQALGSTLQHELVHTILHARFPKGMPIWANEGLASRYDDNERVAIRARVMRQSVKNRQFPSLAVLFATKSFRHAAQIQYATAESATTYLIEHGGAKKFIDFVEDGMQQGWDAALQQHYEIKNIVSLQKNWETWAAQQFNEET